MNRDLNKVYFIIKKLSMLHYLHLVKIVFNIWTNYKVWVIYIGGNKVLIKIYKMVYK